MLKIDAEVYALAASGGLEDLKKALQFAVELEHSTMPPYFYARYSLGAGNTEIVQVLYKIVQEEMHHMLLAGNLLKAIGGNPVIDKPEFVPSYPSNLPGTVASDLIVPLAPFSRQLVRDVFMRIEQPKQILAFETTSLAVSDDEPPKTIGEFYGRIRDAFEADGDALIVDSSGDTQPTHWQMPPNQQKITTKAEALKAIDLIVEQGEGTDTEPVFPDGDGNPSNDELAHYYKFAEIVKGRLKANPDATPNSPPREQYVYDASDQIPFEPASVLPLRTNPKRSQFEEGSPARTAIDGFNRKYTEILKLLHSAFNGEPAKIYDAVSAMNQVRSLVTQITAINLDDGTRPGPTFEYDAGTSG